MSLVELTKRQFIPKALLDPAFFSSAPNSLLLSTHDCYLWTSAPAVPQIFEWHD